MSVLNAPGEVKVGKIAMLLSGITITEERMKSFDLVSAEPAAPAGFGMGVALLS